MKFLTCVLLATSATSLFAQSFVNPNFVGNANGWDQVDNFGGYNGNAGSDGGSGFMWINNNGNSSLPSVFQTVSGFNIGETYTLDFWMMTIQIFNSGDPFKVSIDDQYVFDGPNSNITEWTEFNFDFIATSTTHRFGWHSEVVADSDYALDTVSVQSAVPEPATLSLLGFSALTLLRKKQK